ncbi:VWA domain-containing protein [Halopenitus salinus]|uniref:VWA domain-containing protein n=1 Tax=Halopenitus salinus TaxID=1198295 RepID=A0ABD5UZJ0_9EURY
MIDLGENKKASHDRGEAPSFAGIVGQGELKRGLLAVAADDDLDGLLIRGEKGTAKSTAVRGLADLLPTRTAVAGCPYGCPPADPDRQCADCRERARAELETVERPVPLVTLPLSATRERVVGTLSVADALGGDYEFDPGLLARANRGILYVDEVNLLEDHLVDTLLDAAASGVNRVERDGVSVSHPAEFTLVGTMNPEEGDLRPQLRDRFALQATIEGCRSIDDRVAIIDRALGRSGDGIDREEATDSTTQSAYRDRLERARRRLPDVTLPRSLREEIAELCRDAGIEGHRGDIATARAARTFAALEDRGRVIESDVREAASFALPHRLRSRPFEEAPDAEDLIDDHFDDADSSDSERGEDGGDRGDGSAKGGDHEHDPTDREGGDGERAGGDERGGDDRPDGERGGDDRTGEPDEDGRDRSNRSRTDGRDPGAEPSDGPSAESVAGESTLPGEESTADGEDTADPNGGGADESGEREAGESGEKDGTGDSHAPRPGDAGERGGDVGSDGPEATPVVPGESRVGIEPGSAPDLSVSEPIDAGRGDVGGGSGSRSRPGVQGTDSGPRIRSEPAGGSEASDVNVGASLRAATRRGSDSIESRDLRRSVRRGSADALVAFAIDASASMRPAMRAAKRTVLELLQDAYEHRDEVAVVSFAGSGADVLLPPTDSVELAARHLKDVPTGDRTPLSAGLRTVGEVLARAEPAASVVVVVTDGRANVADGSPSAETREAARELAATGTHVVVVDAGDPERDDRSSLVDVIVEETAGERVSLAALSADRIDATVGTVHEG